jgi:SnoaL-like domain
LARDYFKAFLAGDQDGWHNHIAPAIKRNNPGVPFEVIGPEDIKKLADAMLPGIPDMQLPIERVFAEGTRCSSAFGCRAPMAEI